MSARDTIARCIPGSNSEMCFCLADGIMNALTSAGYVILSPDEVRGIRDEALEEAAKECEQQSRDFLSPEYAFNQPIGSITERFACDECAAAIRSLKGGRDVT